MGVASRREKITICTNTSQKGQILYRTVVFKELFALDGKDKTYQKMILQDERQSQSY